MTNDSAESHAAKNSLPPARKEPTALNYALSGVIAGLFGVPLLVFGLIGAFPPYHDIHGRAAFNGEVVFKMSALAIVGALCLFLCFRWIRRALKLPCQKKRAWCETRSHDRSNPIRKDIEDVSLVKLASYFRVAEAELHAAVLNNEGVKATVFGANAATMGSGQGFLADLFVPQPDLQRARQILATKRA